MLLVYCVTFVLHVDYVLFIVILSLRRKARLLKKGDHLTGVYTLKKSFAKDKAVRKDV